MSTISYINSEEEEISIYTVNSGEFKGRKCLVIRDDDEISDTKAYHLLDKGTVKWLQLALADIAKEQG